MKDKVKAVARESIIVWPQSPSDKKSNKYVKGHDSVAPALQKDLSLTIVDPTSKKGYKDEQTLEAFAEFLKTAKVKAAPTKGGVNVEEMIATLSETEKTYLASDEFQKQAEAAFKEVDVDGSGDLTGEELSAAVEKVVPPARRANLQIQADNAKDLLLFFDKNKNGKIEPDEFKEFVKWIVANDVHDYFHPPNYVGS